MIIKYHSNKIPVTILGNESNTWKLSRRKVLVDYVKRQKLDGISILYKKVMYATANINGLGEVI